VRWLLKKDLAAFATALERRRTDYTTLLGGLSFPRPQYDSALAYEEFLPDQKDKPLALKDSNALVSLNASTSGLET
jgi:hypothetical protein